MSICDLFQVFVRDYTEVVVPLSDVTQLRRIRTLRRPSITATAEFAEDAEKDSLCGLSGLRGCFCLV